MRWQEKTLQQRFQGLRQPRWPFVLISSLFSPVFIDRGYHDILIVTYFCEVLHPLELLKGEISVKSLFAYFFSYPKRPET
jgi:hypothetical protein